MGAREQPITVTAVEDILSRYRRIWFFGPEFLRTAELFPTVWSRLWVPSAETPDVMKQGGRTLVDPDPIARTCAPELVLHEPADAAANWAKNAQVGEVVELAVTRAKLNPEPGIGHFVLLGYATALSASNSWITCRGRLASPCSTPIPAGALTSFPFGSPPRRRTLRHSHHL